MESGIRREAKSDLDFLADVRFEPANRDMGTRVTTISAILLVMVEGLD